MTLFPAPFDGVGGPSYSCERIATALAALGCEQRLFVNRWRGPRHGLAVRAALAGPFGRLPYGPLAGALTALTERRFLDAVAPGDVGAVWPGSGLSVLEALRTRGIPVVLEAVNTPMGLAKEVLDAAYADFGAPPAHGITADRVAEQDARFALADAVFCLNPQTEAGLARTSFAGRILPSSRGVDVFEGPLPDRAARAEDAPVRFVFVGYGCIRKGLNRLLDLWPDLPGRFVLRIVGRIEPVVAERYGDLLASDRIEAVGFSTQVDRHLAEADVFVLPSLEEGDPKVTYEAANMGLPLAVSPVGGGRLHAETGCGLVFDPYDPAALHDTLMALGTSRDLRLARGQAARTAVRRYDWSRVAERRLAAIEALLAG